LARVDAIRKSWRESGRARRAHQLAEIFSALDAAGRLGIPVYRKASKVHIAYQAAILVADV
jgi:hypothetical protein